MWRGPPLAEEAEPRAGPRRRPESLRSLPRRIPRRPCRLSPSGAATVTWGPRGNRVERGVRATLLAATVSTMPRVARAWACCDNCDKVRPPPRGSRRAAELRQRLACIPTGSARRRLARRRRGRRYRARASARDVRGSRLPRAEATGGAPFLPRSAAAATNSETEDAETLRRRNPTARRATRPGRRPSTRSRSPVSGRARRRARGDGALRPFGTPPRRTPRARGRARALCEQ